jgi:cellulose synthase/poly-beta-1,6-N-acetylglucosamine synthase-like glycosyltransferase
VTISIGICCYNEEKNIGQLLASLLSQKTDAPIGEILVISSGSTDRTDRIVEKEFSGTIPPVVLLRQRRREGKASAINLFLKHMSGDIAVLESGDTIPAPGTIAYLTEPFRDRNVGMTGGHPIPVNDEKTFMGYTVHLLWRLHHRLAMRKPKLGELVAFRRDLIDEIPIDTAVDEAFIEAILQKKGYDLRYVPEALVYNRGPENVSDFLKQRRRIFAGHLHLLRTKGYAPSSMNVSIVKLLFEDFTFSPRNLLYTAGAMSLELYGRLLGSYDFFIRKKSHHIWHIAATTKEIPAGKLDARIPVPDSPAGPGRR